MHSNTEAIKDDTGFIRSSIPAIQSQVSTLRHQGELAKHSMLMTWISRMDFSTQQSDFIGRKQEGTGQWFLDAPEFSRWLDQPVKTLFCPGIPGAGKTMIAAIAIDHLLRMAQSDTIGLAYVYCSYKTQADQNVGGLLAAILKQLAQTHPSLAEPVELLYNQHERKKTNPSISEIHNALQAVVSKFLTVYIVVDAVDECRNDDGTRQQLMNKLQTLQKTNDLRLMVTSRYIPDIIDDFRDAMTLEVRARDDDVRRFVAGQVYRLPRCIQCDIALQEEVQVKIVQAVDGM